MLGFKQYLIEKKDIIVCKAKGCDWKGAFEDVHTDRGGHNFICPKCKQDKLYDTVHKMYL